MLSTFTAKYTRIEHGYMGQLVEWPEVITEGEDFEDCRSMFQDALPEMILAYSETHRLEGVSHDLDGLIIPFIRTTKPHADEEKDR